MFKKIFGKLNGKQHLPEATGGYSVQGRKPSQEDSYFISPKKNGKQLILVADGVGGHGHGDFASKLALEIFENTFAQSDTFGDIPDFLRKTSLVVAAMVLQKGMVEPEFQNCGTTLTGFFITDNKYFTLNIGDSRCYHYTKDKLNQITKDHSLIQDMIDKGEITEEEAFVHPQRNIMTSAIGQPLSLLKIDIDGPHEIDFGEILFAFSDGVHDAITDKQILEIVEKYKKDNDLAQKLVDASFAAGGKDNITAVYYRHL